MSGQQIATSVTILNSYLGFQAISLTDFSLTTVSAIAAGSKVEIAGAFFTFTSDETINASSWTAIATGSTAYIALTPSGTAGSQIVTAAFTTTAPVWSVSKQGWYASASSVVRYVAGCYKAGASSYQNKWIIENTPERIKPHGKTFISIAGGTTQTVILPATEFWLIGIGAGGNGGTGAAGSSGSYNGGGGGGGGRGQYKKEYIVNQTPGSSVTVTLNAPGSNTTFGSLMTLITGTAGSNGSGTTGGAGGAGGGDTSVYATGGAGGAGGVSAGSSGYTGGDGIYGGGRGIAGSSGAYGGGGGGGGAPGINEFILSQASNGSAAGGAGGIAGYGGGGGGGGGVGGAGGPGGAGIYGGGGGGGGGGDATGGAGGAGGVGGRGAFIIEW